MKKTVKIDGMTCMHCVAHLEKALSALEGVDSVHVSLEQKCAQLEAQASVTDEVIHEAVYDAGFDIVSIETV